MLWNSSESFGCIEGRLGSRMFLAINLSKEQEERHKGEENTEQNDAEALEAYEVQDEATYHWPEGVAQSVRDVNDGVDAAVDFGVTGVDEKGRSSWW